MKRLLCIGLFFLSISWLYLLHIFSPPDIERGLFFLTLGLIFNVLAFINNKFPEIDKKYFILFIPASAFAFITGFPINIGVIILIITGVIYLVLTYVLKYKKGKWVCLGFGVTGLALLVQATILPLYYLICAHCHRVDFLSPVVSFFGNIMGLHTSVNEGIVFVQSVANVYPFTTTLEKLGFFVWLMMLVGFFTLLLLLPKVKDVIKNIFLFFVISFFYVFIRYVVLMSLYVSYPIKNLGFFWDPNYFFISFFPFALFLIGFISFDSVKIDLKTFRKFAFKRKHLLISIVVFVFVFSVIGSYGYQDPGIRKKERILIDELHSKWEDTIKPMDKEWYGKLSTYSYYNWAEWLNYYYHVDRNINHTLDASLLKNYDILVIKCPTSLFSNEEINAIVDFVKNGGGLYLIGDHTNVFGMNFYLNKISQHFGIIFRYDSTSHLNNGTLSIYRSQKILPHPIIQYTPRFNFLSSCTLKAPITSENVIIGYGLLSCMGTYTTKHYFRTLTSISPDTEQGLFLQVVAVKYGKGRVVAFTDSTCFSNFCMFMDGYPSFNLMTIEYLNRVNFLDFINNMFFGLAIALFVVLIYLFVRYTKKAMAVFLFILVGLTSFSISVPFFSYINKVNYPLPEPHTNFTKICFVKEYSDFSISSRHASLKVSSEKKFNTFFIWLQRMGYVPYVKKNLQEALRNGDAIVIINPMKHFNERDIRAIKDYLKNGGKVVLIDGILNTDSTANELLNNFNMRISHTYHREYLNNSIDSKNVGIARPYLVIYGGNRTLSDKNGFTYVSFVDYGKGRVVAVVDSSMFSNAIMGGAFTVPDASLMRIYNTEFYIFEDIVFGK